MTFDADFFLQTAVKYTAFLLPNDLTLCTFCVYVGEMKMQHHHQVHKRQLKYVSKQKLN